MIDDPSETPSQTALPTTMRTLYVLEKIAEVGVPVTPTEINRHLGLPKPTIHRLFASLEAEGFIQREIDGRSYTPGARLRSMSVGVMSSLRIRTARLSVLTTLTDLLGETCNIAIADRTGMIYLDRVETKWPLRIQLPIGTKVPFHCTAAGKLYLSSLTSAHRERLVRTLHLKALTQNTMTEPEPLLRELSIIRRRGHSEDNEEFMEGMVAIAVPIKDAHDRVLSTLSFHAPTQRVTLEMARKGIPALQKTAEELSALTEV